MLIIRSLLVLILLAAPVQALTGVARVVDGDTVVVNGEKLRLFGVDAPEAAQHCDPSGRNWACGTWATAQLAGLIDGAAVACEARDTDRYGRTVAVCRANGHDLGAEMVRLGAAVAYIRYSDAYVAVEMQAKAEARGIWNGTTTTPGFYRKVARFQPVVVSSCTIKGNVGAKASRIYHLPGQRDYDATRITPAKGEALFCTEAEAQAAGFRKARR